MLCLIVFNLYPVVVMLGISFSLSHSPNAEDRAWSHWRELGEVAGKGGATQVPKKEASLLLQQRSQWSTVAYLEHHETILLSCFPAEGLEALRVFGRNLESQTAKGDVPGRRTQFLITERTWRSLMGCFSHKKIDGQGHLL